MIRVFCSYAHEDEPSLATLTRYLKPLVRGNMIVSWTDRSIIPGQEWEREILAELDAADVILLLVSNNFFASDFAVDIEMERALRRHGLGEAALVPVLLEEVVDLGPLKRLQILPGLDTPVNSGSWHRANDAWVRIVNGVKQVVDERSGLNGYPDDVARDLRQCYVDLDPRHVQRHLQRRTPQANDKDELRSPVNTTGFRWPFRRGAIYWSARGGAHPVWEPIGGRYAELGGSSGQLGFPLSDEIEAAESRWGSVGTCQRFEGSGRREDYSSDGTYSFGASIYRREGDRAVATSGAVGHLYEVLGGTSGPLGFPTDCESAIVSGPGTRGRRQMFEGGGLYAADDHDVHAVTGRMHDTYVRLGGPAGRFGFPVGPEGTIDDELLQEFEGGAIRVDRRAGGAALVGGSRSDHDRRVAPVVTAGSFREGHQEIFVAMPDGRMFNRWDYGDGWSEWAMFGSRPGPFTAMATCSSAENVWEAYAVDAAGALTHRWYRFGEPWSDWEAMDTPRPVVSIAAASYAEGHQELFIALDDGNVFNRWQHGGSGWSAWSWFPAPAPVRSVACNSPRPGDLELFAIDDTSRVRHTVFTQTEYWSEWWEMDAPDRAVAVSLGGRRGGTRQLFVILADGRIVHRWCPGERWSDWSDVGFDGRALAVSGVSRGPLKLEVLAVTATGRLLKRWFVADRDDWDPWSEVDLP